METGVLYVVANKRNKTQVDIYPLNELKKIVLFDTRRERRRVTKMLEVHDDPGFGIKWRKNGFNLAALRCRLLFFVVHATVFLVGQLKQINDVAETEVRRKNWLGYCAKGKKWSGESNSKRHETKRIYYKGAFLKGAFNCYTTTTNFQQQFVQEEVFFTASRGKAVFNCCYSHYFWS